MGIAALLVSGVIAGAAGPEVEGDSTTWLVTSHHPEELERLAPYVAEREDRGRLLLVRLARPVQELPDAVRAMLRPVAPGEARDYRPEAGSTDFVDPRVAALTAEVSRDRLRASVLRLASVRDRSAGTDENRAMTEWTRVELERMGYAARQHCYAAGECNVVAERAGRSRSDETVYVVAHLDSVGHPLAGADDNASGTAGLLEIAQVLAAAPTERTLRFLVVNGEENGLVGSTRYVRTLSAGDVAMIRLAVNMDMIAYNANGLVDLETNSEFEELARWYAGLVTTYTSLRPNITIPAWGSDHVPFLERGAPTLLTIEHWKTKTPCYHRACDRDETLNYPYAAEIVKLNVAAVALKAGLAPAVTRRD